MFRSTAQVLRRQVLPLLLWVTVLVAAFMVWRDLGTGQPIRGFAEATPHRLSPLEPARVESLLVAMGDHVRAGQVVAVLDSRTIDGELAASEADKARILAEITRTRLEARSRRVEAMSRVGDDTANAERALREARTRLGTARAELGALQKELARQRRALAQGLVSASDIAGLEIRHAALTRTIGEEKAAVALYQRQSERAGELGFAGEVTWIEAAVAPLEAELREAEARERILEARRDQYVLRAPVDGQVSAVNGGAQSTVTPDLPLIEIIPDAPTRIVACMAEDASQPIAVGAAATATPLSALDRSLSGRAISIGPVVELPVRCRREPRTPIWGRLVTLELDPAAAVVPGQAFVVRFGSGG